jgi:hypothetical protein
MRSLRLARIAAEAEGLRLRYGLKRAVVRAVLGLLALAFLLGALVLCHVAVWLWLRQAWEALPATLILAGGDVVLAVILALFAARSSPGRVEAEALAVRQRALEAATSGVALSTLAVPLLRLGIDRLRRRRP